MNSTTEYYERYWADPHTAPPAGDPTTAERQALLKRALQRQVPPGGAVLDAGCGAGEFTDFIDRLGYKAVGTDLSEAAVGFARRRYPNSQFRVCTPEQVADELAGQFDAIWSSEVIEHIFDVYSFLVALNKVCKPGGHLILTTPYHGVAKGVMISMFGHAAHFNPFGGHIRFFDKSSLNACLAHCGFTATHWSGFGRFWPLYKSFFVVARKTGEPRPLPPADSHPCE
jgi:2-polyprenyl-3-methyl-5-hydroxy-6-metoxy-1,4-benzoquinol methylase